uniref:U6 snRNA phosphodiesterase 1 n=1 Tax=Sphaeramia orbicularis TaxID=375764 RepID=A0A673AI89_9TELE
MFPDDVDPQTEDSSLHGGRIRSFKHERGNWATYVYLPYHPVEEFGEFLDELLAAVKTHGVVLTPQEEFHISLSQTVVLRHHWIQPFTQSLKTGLAHCKRFMCSAEKLKVYCNAEKTRLGNDHTTQQHKHLLSEADIFYETVEQCNHRWCVLQDPSFHVSLAWCPGDATVQMQECLQQLQTLVDDHEEGPFTLRLDCVELRCRTGNKTFCFPLDS